MMIAMNKDLTKGNMLRNMISFSIPYVIAFFLQTFYGLADLYVVGRFNDTMTVDAVSIGSQAMHMVTVILIGLAMGITVSVSHVIGAGHVKDTSKIIGNGIVIFSAVAVIITVLSLLLRKPFLNLLRTPVEAYDGTLDYITVCFAGIPFITAFNVVSAIFRGMGNSKSPLYFVAISGVLNVGLDFLFVGGMDMGSRGAALATVISQGVSVIISVIMLKKSLARLAEPVKIRRSDLRLSSSIIGKMLRIGAPIALQDGFIQVAFLVITVFANMRGYESSTAVGIVEKVISIAFLINSAVLSSISAIAAQNNGAGLHENSRKVLRYGLIICIVYGILVNVFVQIFCPQIISLFAAGDETVQKLGESYLRSYITDCIFAGIHFCFSGYFTAYDKSWISFLHNSISAVCFRIPLSYIASVMYKDTLFPMGMAAPIGSVVSIAICVIAYLSIRSKRLKAERLS